MEQTQTIQVDFRELLEALSRSGLLPEEVVQDGILIEVVDERGRRTPLAKHGTALSFRFRPIDAIDLPALRIVEARPTAEGAVRILAETAQGRFELRTPALELLE